MNKTIQDQAISLAKAVLSNPQYQLPYKSRYAKENAKHIAELIKHIADELQSNESEIKTSSQDMHATI